MKEVILEQLNTVPGVTVHDFVVLENGEILISADMAANLDQTKAAFAMATKIQEIKGNFQDYIAEQRLLAIPPESNTRS